MNSDFFRIGANYRHRNGAYEVLRIEQGRILGRFADGREEWLNRDVAFRIAQNISIEDGSRIPEGISSEATADFFWTVGILADERQLLLRGGDNYT